MVRRFTYFLFLVFLGKPGEESRVGFINKELFGDGDADCVQSFTIITALARLEACRDTDAVVDLFLLTFELAMFVDEYFERHKERLGRHLRRIDLHGLLK